MVGSSSTSTLGLAPFKALTTWVTPGIIFLYVCLPQSSVRKTNFLPSRGAGRINVFVCDCAQITQQWGFHLGEPNIRVIKFPGCPGSGVIQILE